jgi:hypothetical protein
MNDALTSPHSASKVGQRFGLEAALLELFPAEADVLSATSKLLAQRQEAAAFRLLAWALPRREAVWWATECVRVLLPENASDEERTALEAARRWATDPSEDNRRQAESAAQRINYATPAGQCAIAAFWSGGSLAPAKLAHVTPPDHLLPKACANAVLLVVVTGDPKTIPMRAVQCMELAAKVSDGTNRWQEASPAPIKRKG